MNQTSCDAYCHDFKHNGLLIIDSTLVEQVPTSRVVALPFTQIANQLTGKNLVANIVGLGALVHFCPLISQANLEKALSARAPKGTKGINLKALLAGIKAAKEIDFDALPRSATSEEEEI
jgi:2-oxoglutarate ferredoxin oxidoreductase subunit gamma